MFLSLDPWSCTFKLCEGIPLQLPSFHFPFIPGSCRVWPAPFDVVLTMIKSFGHSLIALP